MATRRLPMSASLETPSTMSIVDTFNSLLETVDTRTSGFRGRIANLFSHAVQATPDWSDMDLLGYRTSVHDGNLHIVAGPDIIDHTWKLPRLRFQFLFLRPFGQHKTVEMSFGISEWKKLDRSGRKDILIRAIFLWEMSRDYLSHLGLSDPEVLVGLGDVDLDQGLMLDGKVHVPEIEKFLSAAASRRRRIEKLLENVDPTIFRDLRHFLCDFTYGLAADRNLQIVEERPWLAACSFEATRNLSAWPGPDSATPETVATILSGQSGTDDAVSPWIVRWMDGWTKEHGLHVPNPAQLAVLDALPRSWLPGDPAQMRAFILLVQHAMPIGIDLEGVLSLLKTSKGRYADLWNTMQADIGVEREVADALKDVGDMIEAACEDLVRPSKSYMLDVAPLRKLNSHTMGFLNAKRPDLVSARRLMTPDGGIRRMLGISERWHRVTHMPISRSSKSWPQAVEDFETENGCVVVELLTEEQLAAEGHEQEHCVGGYGARCAWGGSHVFSIRQSGKTLSTFEARFVVKDSARVTIVQHQGRRRASPDTEAVQAMWEWQSSVEAGTLAVAPRKIVEIRGETRRPAMTLDQWRPFLVKPFCDLPDVELRQEIAVETLRTTMRMLPEGLEPARERDDGYDARQLEEDDADFEFDDEDEFD
jgi:hypothetical protein